ncbi:MAG: prepilin-type N-terminal cleavage/methylation domain-containing protein [Oceanospirillaceae bacterium]|nr:prepilin-type N-terminal cleavage/methylation domain-containing protein [Oceanospirillaceae bacterium]MCP5335884.1 prepilin-type N-terminal cleavage/methylation domain-containing protein [Oceanospirillaceae bacterium]MCP5350358.1 prepilin-type N-terminal cleavage/methylation domain-containing protein [Oceanospirillaceae bacterium]
MRGFTLIEILIVIVVLSVLAVGSVKFISFSAEGYVATARRASLGATGSITAEKLNRALRNALPNSVRVNSAGNCVEFMPVLASSAYRQIPLSYSPTVISRQYIKAVKLAANFNNPAGRLVVYSYATPVDSLYQPVNPGVISTLDASLDNTGSFDADLSDNEIYYVFNGAGNFEFIAESPQKRLFIVSTPVAFCQQGTQLFYYRNYGYVSNVQNIGAAFAGNVPNRLLIADGLQANSLKFSYTPASLRRNALVSYELTLLDASNAAETLNINQAVQVRNVP